MHHSAHRSLPLGAWLDEPGWLVYGCMGLGGSADSAAVTAAQEARAYAALEAARTAGVRLFDHADLYARGKSESVFGRWLERSDVNRSQVFLQSKGGIVPGGASNRYDLSRAAIVACVEGSLERLRTDYLDLWLLHRPDPLLSLDEVAAAFESLHSDGRVRHFGVSNMHHGQLALLRAGLPMALAVNQLQLSLGHLQWLDEGVDFNTGAHAGAVAQTIDWCRRHGVQLQAWGALAQGRFSGRGEAGGAVSQLTGRIARDLGVPPEAVVLAFLLRHPSHIQPVIGTQDPGRIAACARAGEVGLSREQWYALYLAARGRPLP